jgi:outer membrane autotransporter protein
MAVSLPVYAAWETGARMGFDSNVNRGTNGEDSDTYLGGYLLYLKGPSGETRLDWTLSASMEGNGFLKNNDLSNACFTLAPGITFLPHLTWSINVSPFVQGKAVADSDQSALAFGAKVSLRQPIGKQVYLGEYYLYTDSRADDDIYSYTENAFGIFLGINWTRKFFTEIGYEYSRGDSFQTLGTTSTTSTDGMGMKMGKHHSYSSTFETEVYKNKVDRHSIGLTAGIEIIPSLFSNFSYTYSTMKGDLGTSIDHTGSIGLSYHF